MKVGRPGQAVYLRSVRVEGMADDHIRIGDQDRDQAVARLQDFHVEGRLTVEEMEERVQAALQAKTGADIDRLFTDLPGGSPRKQWNAEPTLPATPATSGSPDSPNSPESPPYREFAAHGSRHKSDKSGGLQYSGWAFLWGALILMMVSRGAVWFGVPVAVAFMILLAVKSSSSRRERQIARPVLQRELTAQERQAVMGLIATGRKIQAIKLYREFTGTDLVTAKNTIDAWGRGLPGR